MYGEVTPPLGAPHGQHAAMQPARAPAALQRAGHSGLLAPTRPGAQRAPNGLVRAPLRSARARCLQRAGRSGRAAAPGLRGAALAAGRLAARLLWQACDLRPPPPRLPRAGLAQPAVRSAQGGLFVHGTRAVHCEPALRYAPGARAVHVHYLFFVRSFGGFVFSA